MPQRAAGNRNRFPDHPVIQPLCIVVNGRELGRRQGAGLGGGVQKSIWPTAITIPCAINNRNGSGCALWPFEAFALIGQ